LIIAVDGPSGSGKSSTSKAVAKIMGLTYINTGAMYRALTFFAINHKIDSDQITALVELAKTLRFGFNQDGDVIVNGQTLESSLLQNPDIAHNVSKYCTNAQVRFEITHAQREIAKNQACILDGRDIGTVVFPDADIKFLWLQIIPLEPSGVSWN
jgi:CMP/dCMP kinase